MTTNRDPDLMLDADPPYLYPEYVATRTRAPRKPMVLLPHGLTELTGPVLGTDSVSRGDADLTGTADQRLHRAGDDAPYLDVDLVVPDR